jgi:hypothetical protein
MTARDSIGLDGAFTRFDFSGAGGNISLESVSALYARRISGRSSLELGGGPQIAQSSISGLNQQYVGWQARGTVNYRMRRVNLSAQGMHGVTGGAGVLNGALTTTGQGSANFILARYWSASLNSGVSRNQQLSATESFDSQFAGVVLDRKFGRYTNMFLSYDFQHQTAGSDCIGPACGYVGLRNVFAIGFAWNYHPIGTE